MLWVDKYRPTSLGKLTDVNPQLTERLKAMVRAAVEYQKKIAQFPLSHHGPLCVSVILLYECSPKMARSLICCSTDLLVLARRLASWLY